MATMKAVRIHEYGGTEMLRYEDAPMPVLQDGDVLVKIFASSFNPIDAKIREGVMRQWLKFAMPITLGGDLSGTVESETTNGAPFRKGDEVFATPNMMKRGTFAEYIAIPAAELARKPKTIDHLHAASIPLAGMTAWQTIFDAGGLASGQSILIHGAAGGVGTFAVQLAKWKGAHVFATASAENMDLVRSLGADMVIDYKKTKFEDVARDVDVVLDTLGGDTQKRSWGVLKKGGILVTTIGAASAEEAAAHGVRQAAVSMHPDARSLTQIAELVDSGKLKAIVENTFSLADVRKADELNKKGGVRGKIAIRVA